MGERKELGSSGIYLLMGEIDVDSAKGAIQWILESNIQEGKHRPEKLKLIINSNGGNLQSAFGLTDVIESSTIPVETVGLGLIASCGLLIFMTGHNRIVTPNTSILSHQYHWGGFGKRHELLADNVEHDNLQKRLIQHYKKHTGLTEKVINEKLMPPSEVWLNATQAKKLNLCDKVKPFSNK